MPASPQLRRLASTVAIMLGACGQPAPPAASPPPPPHDAAAVAASLGEVVIELASDPGLSDLALAPDGSLWTVAERGQAAFRIVLDGDRLGSLERVAITGLPAGVDLEAIDVLEGGGLILGTEGHDVGAAGVWLASPAADGSMTATALLAIDGARLGLTVQANHGVEGVCALAGPLTVVAAIETVEEQGGVRLAPVLVQQLDTPGARPMPALHRVRLTSPTGKLSAIDCTPSPRGDGVDVIAIERHFEVTRIVGFHLPARPGAAPVEATVVLDLATMARGRNFEGLARLADGRLALVVDNQWKTIDGPSVLVLITPP